MSVLMIHAARPFCCHRALWPIARWLWRGAIWRFEAATGADFEVAASFYQSVGEAAYAEWFLLHDKYLEAREGREYR